MKKIAAVFAAVLLGAGAVLAQGAGAAGTFTDARDGKTYKTMTVGGKTWFAENLNYNTKAGDSKCSNGTKKGCEEEGRRYDWKTAREVCPAGWRLPTRQEWVVLEQALSNKISFSKFGYVHAVPDLWDDSPGYVTLSRCYVEGLADSVLAWGDKFAVRCVQDGSGAANVAAGSAKTAASVFGALTDSRDAKTYKTRQIGKRNWMAENLNYQTASGSWCYGNENANCAKYGRMYDWKTAMAACPRGWYIPSREEWNELLNEVGGIKEAGDRLKAESGWIKNGSGTDDFGFSALPGGFRETDGSFVAVGEGGLWWTSSKNGGTKTTVAAMSYEIDGAVVVDAGSVDDKGAGASIRCVEGTPGAANPAPAAEENASGSFTDSRDSKTYKTRRIGKKRWFAENLNYQTPSGSWCYSNDNSNCAKYGRLYDWKTAMTACPKGWRAPSVDEWNDLEAEAGGRDAAGKALKAAAGWMSGGSGTDAHQFSALPGGARHGDADYQGALKQGSWWTSKRGGNDNGWVGSRHIYDNKAAVVEGMEEIKKGFGYSVRCVEE